MTSKDKATISKVAANQLHSILQDMEMNDVEIFVFEKSNFFHSDRNFQSGMFLD